MLPVLTSERRTSHELCWAFTVPSQTPFFAGHFPGHPILPGVVALSWMLSAAERFRGGAALGSLTLLNVKFQVVIEPGATVELTVVPKSGGHLLGTIRSEAGVHATALIPVTDG
jgi:3-hydroxymyristoyl/3-hydroxydecanoyl-(acyl carrier protein) dehydratase